MVKLNTQMVAGLFLVVIVIILVFTIVGDTSVDVGDSAANLTNKSNVYPLTSFFAKKGVILLAFMAGVAIVVITGVLRTGK